MTDQEARAALVEKLKLVEDNDLWRHALADSKPFNVGLGALKLEYDFLKNPQIFETLLALKTSEVVESGKTLTEARNAKIAELIQTKFVIAISDGETLNFLSLFLFSFFLSQLLPPASPQAPPSTPGLQSPQTSQKSGASLGTSLLC